MIFACFNFKSPFIYFILIEFVNYENVKNKPGNSVITSKTIMFAYTNIYKYVFKYIYAYFVYTYVDTCK